MFQDSSPALDLKKNFRARLDGALTRLDLVTREEFEAERELVTRLTERVESLAAKIEAAGETTGTTDKRSARKTSKG
ncbi:MAG: accessory factor UbiK family protein [Gammaproteobacteria bacterium]